jgi:hypothetical protein
MKRPIALDRDDRRALATLASYLLLVGCALLSLVALTLTLALCVRLFTWAVGV